jgi:hypothetical protein
MCLKGKQLYVTSGTIFTLLAVLHLLRIVRGWEANIAGWQVPMWFSWIAIVVAGYLAYSFWKMK